MTWGWESSTSNDAVSLSVVLMSVSPFLTVIFLAVKTHHKIKKNLHSLPYFEVFSQEPVVQAFIGYCAAAEAV